jgi:hypothetical protein
VSVHPAIIVRFRDRLAADPAAMWRRASLVEHPFSTIKDRHGYTGLLCKGIKQASAEMNLSAWAYNFTRVVNLVGLGCAASSHWASERATTRLKREGNLPIKPLGRPWSAPVPRKSPASGGAQDNTGFQNQNHAWPPRIC